MNIFLLGATIHFLTPWTILGSGFFNKVPSFVQKYPQIIYDIITITVALSHLLIAPYIYLDNLEIPFYGLGISFIIGMSLPILLWLNQGRRVNVNLKLNFDIVFWLPLSAIAEELMWRVSIPYFLLDHFSFPFVVVIFISILGFIILHVPLNGLKIIPYITLFTIIAWIIYVLFGIIGVSLYHVIHNYVVVLVKPRNKAPNNSFKSPKSQTDW